MAKETAAEQLARMSAAMGGASATARDAGTKRPPRTPRARKVTTSEPKPEPAPATAVPATDGAARAPRRKFRPGQPRDAVRYSMVLDAPQHRTLRLLTADHAIDASDIFRAVIDLMHEDDALTTRIVERIIATYE